jgi:hypothetical protein
LREQSEGVTKLYIFDMDGTLIDTGDGDHVLKGGPKDKSLEWEKFYGESWPLNGIGEPKGWWSAPESLDFKAMDLPLFQDVYGEYKKAMADPTIYVVLMTGRLKRKLTGEVTALLNYHNLTFEETLLNSGGDTADFKMKEATRIMTEKPSIKDVMFFEDRVDHAVRFKAWAETVENINIVINFNDHK